MDLGRYIHWHSIVLAILLAAIAADVAFGLDVLLNTVSTVLLLGSMLAAAMIFALAAAALAWITIRDLIEDMRADGAMAIAWRWKVLAIAGVVGIFIDGAVGAWNAYQRHIQFSTAVENIPFSGVPIFLLLASYPFRWIEQYLERRKSRQGRVSGMNVFANTFLLVYAALFPIINPVGCAPLFLGMTRHRTQRERNALAGRVAINSFFLLLGSLVVGSHVLEFFGISLPVVRIGGGLVVTAFGWQLLNSGVSIDSESAAVAQPGELDTFYPFTMPLTVGPGSISAAIALGSQRPSLANLPQLAVLGAAAIVGLLAIAATIYLCYRFAEDTVTKLGEAGTNVVVRLSAFILLCIGIQIVWTGWTGLMALPH